MDTTLFLEQFLEDCLWSVLVLGDRQNQLEKKASEKALKSFEL